eukprot:4769354-Lingulodinium_polyedra.AAC.1
MSLPSPLLGAGRWTSPKLSMVLVPRRACPCLTTAPRHGCGGMANGGAHVAHSFLSATQA